MQIENMIIISNFCIKLYLIGYEKGISAIEVVPAIIFSIVNQSNAGLIALVCSYMYAECQVVLEGWWAHDFSSWNENEPHSRRLPQNMQQALSHC